MDVCHSNWNSENVMCSVDVCPPVRHRSGSRLSMRRLRLRMSMKVPLKALNQVKPRKPRWVRACHKKCRDLFDVIRNLMLFLNSIQFVYASVGQNRFCVTSANIGCSLTATLFCDNDVYEPKIKHCCNALYFLLFFRRQKHLHCIIKLLTCRNMTSLKSLPKLTMSSSRPLCSRRWSFMCLVCFIHWASIVNGSWSSSPQNLSFMMYSMLAWNT